MTTLSEATSITVNVTGARGPIGPASGPLGSGSVVAANISNVSADQDAIAAKIRAHQKQGNGSLFVNGGTTSGLGLRRDDAAIAIQPPVAGTSGQRHAGILFNDVWGNDEAYIAAHQLMSDSSSPQVNTIFMSLVGHDNTLASYKPYIGMHGVSYRGDYTPAIAYMDNRFEVCAGSTGASPFDLGYTALDCFHNFQLSYLQGGAVLGEHAQSFADFANKLEVGGFAFFGAVDGTTKVSTTGLHMGWQAGSSQSLIQSFAWNTGTFQPLTINSTETRFGQGHVVPDADNTRDLGKSGGAWRNVFSVNALTVTSDARLKQVRGDGRMTAEEIAWAKAIRFVPYQMKEARKAKGDAARLHFGVIAQDVAEAGRQAGIEDPFAYGFLTLDPRFETIVEKVPHEQPVMIEDPEPHFHLEHRDGHAVRVKAPPRMVPKIERVPIHGEDGEPVMVRERQGKRTRNRGTGKDFVAPPKMVPATIERPVTKTVYEQVPRSVPVIVEEGSPESAWALRLPDGRLQDQLHGVRYEGLFAFLLACGVLGAPASEPA